MSRAPDHDPADRRPPTNWTRVAVALAGIVIGLLIVWWGIAGIGG